VQTLTLTLALLLPATVAASPLVSHYTACTGSWDGAGQTACEILGVPGTVYTTALDLSPYRPDGVLLYEITALNVGNTLTRTPDGGLEYWTGTRLLTSQAHPVQFAYWHTPGAILVGVEDLTHPSDWDYNDYIVRYEDELPPAVPEAGTVGLVLLGLARAWRRYGRRR
jgi:hypothetical protein